MDKLEELIRQAKIKINNLENPTEGECTVSTLVNKGEHGIVAIIAVKLDSLEFLKIDLNKDESKASDSSEEFILELLENYNYTQPKMMITAPKDVYVKEIFEEATNLTKSMEYMFKNFTKIQEILEFTNNK